MSFLLPEGVVAVSGLHAPSADGCELFVCGGSYVEIIGPSREAIFEHATLLLRTIARGRGPFSIASTVESPPPNSGRDSWGIIVGADVAFSPTRIGATFPRRAPPATKTPLVMLQGGRA